MLSGERLRTFNENSLSVKQVLEDFHKRPVYNLEVDQTHCYAVSTSAIIVHNTDDYNLEQNRRPRQLATGEVPLGTPLSESHHNLTVTLRGNGEIVDSRQFVSGNLTEDEITRGRVSGIGWRVGDTENRALRAMVDDFQPGDRVMFDGFFEPCPDCQQMMMDYSRLHQIDIRYRFLDSANRVRIWSGQQVGYIYIGT